MALEWCLAGVLPQAVTFWVQGMQLKAGGKGFIDIGYELDLEGGAEYEWRKRWDGVNHVEKKVI